MAAKTQKTTASVTAYLDAIEDKDRRADAKALLKLMKAATGEKPAMWGEAIVGFGSYATGTGEWPVVGFSPRKANFALYGLRGTVKADPKLLARLGKHKAGTGCLYLTRLADVDTAVLGEIVTRAMRKQG